MIFSDKSPGVYFIFVIIISFLKQVKVLEWYSYEGEVKR